jgi:hypothetical protein
MRKYPGEFTHNELTDEVCKKYNGPKVQAHKNGQEKSNYLSSVY